MDEEQNPSGSQQEGWKARLADQIGTATRKVREQAAAHADIVRETRALQQTRKELVRATEEARVQAERVVNDPVGTVRNVATKTRLMREEYETANKRGRVKTWVMKQIGKGVSRVVIGGTLEAPIFFGYGVGDVIALFNGILGRDLYTGGGRIDPLDRGIYIIGAVIPGVPASVTVAIADVARFGFESIFARKDQQKQGNK